MHTSDFDYNLPEELIAQAPASPRDSSKLMVVDKKNQTWERKHFFDIVNYLSEGDLLVWNNSKVFKARLFGEVLLDEASDGVAPPPFKEGAGGGQNQSQPIRMIGFNRTLKFRRELRQNKTEAEKLLWLQLKNKHLGGLKFRRQYGIGAYVVDFYQPESKTIIEVDGDVHFSIDAQVKKDLDRTKWFESMGYKVLRFNNIDIFNNLEWILEYIYHNVSVALTPPCPPLKRGGVETTGHILNAPKKIEIFLVRPMENNFVWRVLAKPGKKLRLGMKVKFAEGFEGEVMMKEDDGTILMQFADDDMIVREKANKYGQVPTPPYVHTLQPSFNRGGGKHIPTSPPSSKGGGGVCLEEQYQTVYAKSEGSVAAPTAGFHFTPELIEKLKNKGVQFAEVTLHVGLGTFLPVKSKKIEDHKMHSEWVELTAKNASLINLAKAEGRRVVAVGTTTVRTLEGVAALTDGRVDTVESYRGDINIFITPGHKFKVIDALITNFHLPKSTLLMLVAAFDGNREFILECYQEAIRQNYRFYSFGDAMLIK